MDIEAVIGRIGDFTDDAILITEAELIDRPGPRIVWANAAFTRMTGYTLDEIRGQTPRILQGPDTDPAARQKMREAMQAWTSVRVELKNYRKDGTPFWVDLGIQPVTDRDGWHHYWIAIQRETTERHERDQLLLQTTRIIESAPMAFGLLSHDNRLRLTNDRLIRLIYGDRMPPALPLPYEGWLRHGLMPSETEAGPAGDAAAASAWLRRHIAGLFSPPYRVEQRIGDTWYEFRRIATQEGDQLIIGEDIDDRIQLQDQLRHMTKIDAMGQLTSGVAHDFNNILAVILGNVELLQADGVSGQDRDAFIAETITAVTKGRSLTQSLLSFARKARLNPATTRLVPETEQTLAMFQRTLAPSISIESTFEPDLPGVFIDTHLYQNALLNLLINARDAMPGGGQIRINAQRVAAGQRADGAEDPDRVMISVADTGAGMEDHVLQQAIEPFFTTKGAGRGSGLGLSMVHGFVTQSGGTLSVSSQPGAGTTVTMTFPSVDYAAPDQPGPALHGDAMIAGRRVLLVEDEGSIRSLLSRVLERAGATVTACASGDEAMQNPESWPDHDLLLTDIVMPGRVQGDTLAKHFSERCPATPILMMTGNPEIMNATPVISAAKTAVLPKPVARTELLNTLATLMD